MLRITENEWDVIVIGGGPAGSTAATTLAKKGRRVLVLEKTKFPRFHIGESLLPYNRQIFEDLGVWEKIAAAGFMRKRAAQFIMGDDSRGNRLDFSKGAFTEFPEAMQVERAKFDEILLHHSREHGAEVREECQVLDHRIEDQRIVLKYRSADGEEREITSSFMIDASGLGNVTANRESQREYYAEHRKLAIFSHFSGVDMPKEEQEGDILIIRRENSWLWFIPLSSEKTSVGLVIDAADFKASGMTPQEAFDHAIATTPAAGKRFEEAVLLEKLHVMADFSYKNERLVSPRVVRVGDASGFIDPMFSSGILLAMTSAQQGALAVDQALTTGKELTKEMLRYEKENRQRIALYWEFIENFYKLHFTQFFFQPNNRLGLVCSVNAVLAGRTNLSFSVWWRLRLFFFLAWLNRYVPVVERIKIQ